MPALSLGDLTACCSKEIIHRAGLLCQVFISEQSLLSSCSGSHLLRLMESFPHPKALRPPRLLAASSSELNNHAPSERPQIHGGETPFPFPSAAARGPLLAPSACTARAHSEPGAGAGSQHDAPGMHDLLLPLQRARCCCFLSAGSGAVWRCAGTPKHLGDFGGDQEEKGGPVACRCKETSVQSHRVKVRGGLWQACSASSSRIRVCI